MEELLIFVSATTRAMMSRRRLLASLPVIAIAIMLSTVLAEESDGIIQLGDVSFPHELHFAELELECVTCHHETNAGPLNVPHLEYFADSWARCKKCHTNGERQIDSLACSSCHPDTPTNVADETLSAKVVIHRSCWTCHEVGRGQAASLVCKSCHSDAVEAQQ